MFITITIDVIIAILVMIKRFSSTKKDKSKTYQKSHRDASHPAPGPQCSTRHPLPRTSTSCTSPQAAPGQVNPRHLPLQELRHLLVRERHHLLRGKESRSDVEESLPPSTNLTRWEPDRHTALNIVAIMLAMRGGATAWSASKDVNLSS